MTDETNYFASCPRGTEELLLSELKKHKLIGKIARGGVSFQGNDQKTIEFILDTRIASRVFKELHNFFIRNENSIYRNARNIAWDQFISNRETFKISTLLDKYTKDAFKNSMYLSQLLKDALVDHMRSKTGKRPDVNPQDADISFLQRIEDQGRNKDFKVMVYVDMTGRSLDKRGYRESGHMAPLRENLAAAIVMTTDWKSEKEKYFDPMVGSGTLLIEAILYKERISPAFLTLKNDKRPYSFQKQPWFKNSDLNQWFQGRVEELIDKSREKIANMKSGFFYASDIEETNLKLTKKHLRKCFGKIDFITFTQDDFINSNDEEIQHDLIVFNPPYGERLESNKQMDDFYYQMGETLKNKYKNSRAYIFTLHGGLRKNIRLKATMKKEFFNGDLDCRLLRYQID